VQDGQIKLPWFYPEWATPTARLVAIGLLFIGVSMAFPYVPGSGSKAFQGAGLFFGVLAVLGSSAVATNMISGMVLIYTRSFQEGDLIRIDQLTGTVQSSTLLVTRLRTASNELVSVPNSTLLSSYITNFSLSKREVNEPVALTPEVTIGYDIPWRVVHELLIDAARQTEGIGTDPRPLVLQTSLNDFHITYKLIAFLLDDHAYPQTLSSLLGHIQDVFAEAEVEILSPGYQALRRGRSSTVPPH
jgi:small-conductance mechanosensitive channel